jgi:exopolysaccharide biosynthesis predicted pyruvyltransferase EpsI
VNLISKATLVITDSFHGTAFSLLFQKQFAVVQNTKNPIRVMELLKSVGLSDRIGIEERNVMDEISYDETANKIALIRDDSIQWLNNAIEV